MGGQRHRPLPGWRAAQQGFAQQDTRLGAGPLGLRVPELLAGLQHDRRDARQSGHATSSASQRAGERILHVRSRAVELPLDESPRPRGVATCATEWRACHGRLGRCPARGSYAAHWQAGLCARFAESPERSALPARQAGGEDCRSGCVPGESGSGSAATWRGRSRAPRRSGGQRARRRTRGLHAIRRAIERHAGGRRPHRRG